MTPSFYTSRFIDLKWISARSFILSLSAPEGFSFEPGQYIQMEWRGEKRDYSLISAPLDQHLSFLVRWVKGGVFSNRLADLKPKDTVLISGPKGYFTFRPSQNKAILVATGTGIAPFISYVRSGKKIPCLIHGVSELSEMYFKDELIKACRAYIPCISDHEGKGEGEGDLHHGRVTDYINNHLPKGPYDFYLSGRSDMIRDMMHLIDEHFAGSRIFSESFF